MTDEMIPSLPVCGRIVGEMLAAHGSLPDALADEWLPSEWSFGTGERLRVRGGPTLEEGICRLYGDVLNGIVPEVDVPFLWDTLREQRGAELLRIIIEARERLEAAG